uniref:Rho-GAP domain-containing protein n=1 Tax=Parastrongyloides trichosuri TaxID=131310 RepID=A0A0N4Z4D4_PARTI
MNDSNGNFNIEEKIDLLIKNERSKNNLLNINLKEIIRLNNNNEEVLKKGPDSIYFSVSDRNGTVIENKNFKRNDCLVPANKFHSTVLMSMSRDQVNRSRGNSNIVEYIDNLLRPCSTINESYQSSFASYSDETPIARERKKLLFKDDQNVEYEKILIKRRLSFTKNTSIRRSISESNLLEEEPIIENQLLRRQKLKENSTYWTPLDLGGNNIEESYIEGSEIKHVLPINASHTYVKRRGFNIKCCFCPNRKFASGDKLVCVSCGIEMHLGCRKNNFNVPCVAMEGRRKMEQTKFPVYLGKICTTSRPMIPAVLIRLIDRIETSSMLTTPGLYCHVAEKQNDQQILKDIVQEKFYIMFDKKSIFSVPDALKRLLNNLAEPIIPPSSWSDVCLSVRKADYKTIYKEILNLPITNKDTLAFLIRHFQIVIGLSDRNKMTLSVVAKQFAKVIIGIPKFRREKYGTTKDCRYFSEEALKFLIEINHDFWNLILKTSNDPPFNVFLIRNNIFNIYN